MKECKTAYCRSIEERLPISAWWNQENFRKRKKGSLDECKFARQTGWGEIFRSLGAMGTLNQTSAHYEQNFKLYFTLVTFNWNGNSQMWLAATILDRADYTLERKDIAFFPLFPLLPEKQVLWPVTLDHEDGTSPREWEGLGSLIPCGHLAVGLMFRLLCEKDINAYTA